MATIDLAALRSNAAEALRLADGRELIAVVKADGYGHGAVPVARALLEAGCSRLAVVTVREAEALREAAVAAPILVLGGVADPREAERAVALRLSPTIHHDGQLALLAAAARHARGGVRPRVHVEVDTGMRRMGVAPVRAVDLLAQVAGEPAVELEGVFTHFARADEPDLAPTLDQIELFRRILQAAAERGVRPPLVHAANSAALVAGKRVAEALPEANAVRPGLMLYGVHPSPARGEPVRLRAVMTLRTRVSHLHAVAPGDGVGYGATWRADQPTWVATLPLGYADGVPWAAGNRGRVWLAGAARPIAGRVSMDYVSVRVDDGPVEIGDEAIVFGGDGDAGIPAAEAAEAAGTIAYEILVRVGERVPRVVV